MKIVTAALLLVIVTVHADEIPDNLEECLTDNGIKPDEYPALKDKQDPKLHCIMACMFEKEGMMKNGDIDQNSTVTVLLKKNDKISKPVLTDLVSSCMEKVKDINDICDVTNEFKNCLGKN